MSQPELATNPNHKSFRNRVQSAGIMTLLGYLASQILRFGSNLILTRLLVPEMFGVMAIATVIMIGLNQFSDTGLLQNIVHSKRGESPRFLNTAWLIQIARGVLVCLLALLTGWLLFVGGEQGWLPANTAFSEPVLSDVIAVISITALIQGFSSTRMLVLNRKLLMGRLTLMELISQATGITVMIGLAWYQPSIWALVVGGVVSTIVKTVMSHTFLPGHINRFEWDKKAFFEIFHFGKWIFVSSVLGFLINHGDRLLLGGMISVKLLGVYSIAYFLATAAIQVIYHMSDRILLPALGEVARERPMELSNIYYKIRARVDRVSMFLCGFLFATGEIIVEVLYDDRYLEAGWMLQVISISLVGVGFFLADKCLVVLGHVKQRTLLIVVNLITLYGLFHILYDLYGMTGVVWLIALSWVPRAIVSLWLMNRYNILKIKNEFYMFPYIIPGLIIGVAIDYLVRTLLSL